MAKGDFRYRPRYVFWSTIVIFVLAGVGLGWILSRDQIDDTLNILPGSLFGLAVAGWLSYRQGLYRFPDTAEPYEHPVLGLYSGLAATIMLLLLDESWGYALLVGVAVGIALAVAAVAFRRWRTRKDDPNRHRPVPTVTGWR